ncbi:MAG: electron transfer flavoprotein subunit beta/FixA family protein [Hyphomicrobiaceae bacterium]|nr:electron transfer flavoprotein subunit beta/FixA family protein [Hyphomicrobiaceae bacterium]
MKVLVPVKRVIDYNVKVRVKAHGSGVVLSNWKMSMNPFDEIAVEEAVRMREAGTCDELVVVSIGPKQAEDTLRTALALGADKAILIESDERVEPLAVAKLLKELAAREAPDLVLLGKQAIDDDAAQTGPMLSALLDWPISSFAAKIEAKDDALEVIEEADNGREVVTLPLPAIVTVDLQLNQPRNVSLPSVIKAKQKPLERLAAADFGVDLAPRLEILATRAPDPRPEGKRVGSVDELLAALRSHAGLLEGEAR